MKPTRYWRQKKPHALTPAQLYAHKENYQLFQLRGMLAHCRELAFVEHRNTALYRELAISIQTIIERVQTQQKCRMTHNQSKGCEDESCRAS